MRNTILIDGNNLAMRNWHTNGHMCNDEGVGTGIVYGVYKSLLYSLDILKGSDCIVAWDKGRDFRQALFREHLDSFRHLDHLCKRGTMNYTERMLLGYKGARSKIENIDDFYTQQELTKEFLKAIGVIQVEVPGVEADDIIYYLSHKIKHLTTVSSMDTDYLQMVYKNSNVHWITKKMSTPAIFTIDNFSKLYEKLKGFPLDRKNFLLFKAIVGDKSDNIPGIRGIGEKGLAKAMSQYNYNFKRFLNSDHKYALKLIEQKDVLSFCLKAISLKYAYDTELKDLLDNHVNIEKPKKDLTKAYKMAKKLNLDEFVKDFDKNVSILSNE